MKGGGGGTARLGGQIHEHQIGDPGPVGEMRKVQSRLLVSASRPVHRHHRKRVEDTLRSIHLHGDGGEPSATEHSAAHRPQEIGRIGRGERLFDEPGSLPVGLQRNLRLFERDAPAHQLAAHLHRFLSQVVKGRRGADSSLLAAHREEDVPDGWAGSHPGYSDVGQVKAHDAADGTVGNHFHRSRHQLALPVG